MRLLEVTTLQDHEIDSVAKILSEWNPLGEDSVKVKDLDGYSTEAIDIVCELNMSMGKPNAEKIVQEVLNEAFDLSLTRQECAPYARRIVECLKTTGT
jgi:hypothetical protein